jgi:tetratricopeptide (TPR) repeat protein
MAENFDKELDFVEDKVVTLKEGEPEEKGVSKPEEKNRLQISVPNPKEILKEQKDKLTNKITSNKDGVKIYGLALLSLVSLFFIMILVFMIGDDEEKSDWNSGGEDDFKLYTDIAFKQSQLPKSKESQVEELVQKANFLYQSGNREDALKLYGRIATYNASLSYYNLGVSRIKKGQCEEAIEAFDRAIQNREHITPSAINAAICSKELNRPNEMKAYLDLAYKHLPEELDSSLYSYYYSLIAYYRGNYFEAFSSLQHRTSEHFEDSKNMMETRVNLLYENYSHSADSLEKSVQNEDIASLGLIYANLGDLEVAKKKLQDAIERRLDSGTDEYIRNRYALALVDTKLGNVGLAGSSIHALYEEYGDENISPHYNLDLSLKEDLFDVQKAQEHFRKELQFVKMQSYQILFYFAPYKVFDAKKSINEIKKGSANIAIGDSDEAQNYLIDGARSSDVNKNIVLAIQEVLKKRLRMANRILKEMIEENPKHAILHYNLALTYAQLGDMASASDHFVRSFHLNSRDYLSGALALLAGELAGKDFKQLGEVLNENLSFEPDSNEKAFILAILDFKRNSTPLLKEWIDNMSKESKKDLFHLSLAYLGTIVFEDVEQNKIFAKKIYSKLPDDIMVNMLYMYSNFKDLDIKEFSKYVIHHFQTHKLPLYDFYYGPRITQEFFIKFHLLTGYLNELEKKLEHFRKVEIVNPEGILQALALTKIYNQNFSEAFDIYNELIDKHKADDSRTVFLGGVSAFGAKDYPNAVALFELAKIKNVLNLETRYALGLLYLQIKNYEAAGIQLKRFNAKFFSDFFDFNIARPEI